ncbi:MAG: M48 family metallopeptidase, partial [Patescibacteria group bacterium]
MPTLYTHKDSNIRKTWVLISLFLILIIGLGWVFSYQFNSPVILVIAVLFSSITSFISYWYSDKIVLAMSRAKEIKHEENPELYHIVENLCITAGLPLPRIYIIEEMAPNAFATGRDSKHAVVAVTRGLLEKLDRSELEGVLAHELSHIGNRDILLQTMVVVLVGLVVLLSDWFLRWSFFGRRNNDNKGQLGAIMAIAGIVLALLSPLIAMLLQMSISRKREFLAD